MAKVCAICNKGSTMGNRIVRHGLSKKSGGIGLHTTAVTRRRFLPNLQRVRANINGTVRTIQVCAACIKAGKVMKA